MATLKQLITPLQLINNVPIAKTADHALLDKIIYTEQETTIHNILGTTLYNKIIDEAVGGTISGKRKDLVTKYLIPCLYQYSYSQAILHLNLRVTDKGVVEQSDTNASQSSRSSVEQLRNEIVNKGQFFAELAVRFICENLEDFPEFREWDENGGIRGQDSGYFSGIVFD